MPKQETPPETTDERLDIIIEYMRRMDRREKMRSAGAFVSGMIRLVPIAIFLWGSWFFYLHGDSVIQNITEQAARQAAKIAGENANTMVQTIDASTLKEQFDSLFKKEQAEPTP